MTNGESTTELEEIDLEREFSDLMPWAFSPGTPPAGEAERAHRAQVLERLNQRYDEPLRSQVVAALNRKIERGNLANWFLFRLYPEPIFLPERRWVRFSPFNEQLARHLAAIRLPLFCAMLQRLLDASCPSGNDLRSMFFLSMTLDDRWSDPSFLRTVTSEARPVRVDRWPVLQVCRKNAVHDQCYPVGYMTARVLGVIQQTGANIDLPNDGLAGVYRGVCQFVRGGEIGIDMPLNVTEYLGAVRTLNAIDGIPMLAHHRNASTSAAALPATAVKRMVTGKPLTSGEVRDTLALTAVGDDGADFPNTPRSDETVTVVDQRARAILADWRNQVGTVVPRSTVAGRIRDAMSVNSATHLEMLLAEWVARLVEDKRQYAPRTVYEYYHPVSKALLPYSERLPGDAQDCASWQRFYEDALSADTTSAHVTSMVRRFHAHLMRRNLAPQVNWSSHDLQSRVDNNLVSHAEYRRCWDLLAEHSRPRTREACCMMLLLGFRLGLRFNEARRITLAQLEDAAAPWLDISTNQWQPRLKSQPRRLPMYALVTPDELAEIQAFRQTRLEETGDDGAALIGEPGSIEPIPERRLRPTISTAIAHATGDKSVGYHHLRHSFATWTLYALLRPLLYGECLEPLAACNDPELTTEKCTALRHQLLVQESGQEAMWLITQMLGHVGTDVTRQHYIRLLEWCGLVESWVMQNADGRTLAVLMGIERSSAYELAGRWPRVCRKRASKDWLSDTDLRIPVDDGPASMDYQGLKRAAVSEEAERLCRSVMDIPSKAVVGLDQIRHYARSWQIEGDQLIRYMDSALVVHHAYVTRRGKSRFAPVVHWPRPHDDQTDLRTWIGTFAGHVENDPVHALRRVGVLVRHASTSLTRERSSVRAPTSRCARRLIETMDDILGIPRDRIRILAYPVQGESAAGWRQRQESLARALGVRAERVAIRPGTERLPAPPEFVELSIQSLYRPADHWSRRGSEAFRALVHYLLICREMTRDNPTANPRWVISKGS